MMMMFIGTETLVTQQRDGLYRPRLGAL